MVMVEVRPGCSLVWGPVTSLSSTENPQHNLKALGEGPAASCLCIVCIMLWASVSRGH